MNFVWFWTFWHWSKESFREGCLLHGPLHGIGSHWDEWFHHEASAADREIIEQIGLSASSQRLFITWLLSHWASEAGLPENKPSRYFVLGRLAEVAPFRQWPAFEEYRSHGGQTGISAIVLGENSLGEAGDVRVIEAITLPADPIGPSIISEGFNAESADLETPRRAAMSLLAGRGLFVLLMLWVAGGRRSYPRWLGALLCAGWLTMGGLILYLLFGPDPGGSLFSLCAALVAIWSSLVLTAIVSIVIQSLRAWRMGRECRTQLEQSQVRIRMAGGLTIRGGSAGLAFCLNTLLSALVAHKQEGRSSPLWRCFQSNFSKQAASWAATGVITGDGFVKPVVIEPKLRASLLRKEIKHIFTPRQPGAIQRTVNRLAEALVPASRRDGETTPQAGGARLGFAADTPTMRVHSCRHAAQAVMRLGNLTSRWQKLVNALAIVITVVMACAFFDLRGILLPPEAPAPAPPVSTSPYYLWVSLDTAQPQCFQVVLESAYWANRHTTVQYYGGANSSVRAELRLEPLTKPGVMDENDGTILVQRRYRFLNREFLPGELVGRYSITYLSHLSYE